MDEAWARRSKRSLILILYKKRVGRTQVEMCTRSKVDAGNLFDVPILYGPGTSTVQSETNNRNLFEVPISYGSGIYTCQSHDKNGATKRLKLGKTVRFTNKQLVRLQLLDVILILGMWKIHWCYLNWLMKFSKDVTKKL